MTRPAKSNPRAMDREIETRRLLLRQWLPEDEAAMAAINRDPEVTRYLNQRSGDAAAGFGEQAEAHWERHGFGFYALEVRDGDLAGQMIGFVGIALPYFLPELSHRPELGWRLARPAWGRGLATEAASAVRDRALAPSGFPELISIIHPENARSQALARRLGMAIEGHVRNPLLGRDVEVWRAGRPV